MSQGSSLDLNKISVLGMSEGSSSDLNKISVLGMSVGSSWYLQNFFKKKACLRAVPAT